MLSGEAGIGKTRLLAEFTAPSAEGAPRASQLENASQTHPGRSARFAKPWRRSCAKHRSHTSSPPRPSSAASQHWCPTHSKRSAPRSSRPTPWRKRTSLAACWVSSTCWLPSARSSSPSRTCTGPRGDARALGVRWRAHRGPRVLVVATYRDDEVRDGHPLFAILARLSREQTVVHIALEPLADRRCGRSFTRRWGLVIRSDPTTSARSSRERRQPVLRRGAPEKSARSHRGVHAVASAFRSRDDPRSSQATGPARPGDCGLRRRVRRRFGP